jgi:hypothetical protein
VADLYRIMKTNVHTEVGAKMNAVAQSEAGLVRSRRSDLTGSPSVITTQLVVTQ